MAYLYKPRRPSKKEAPAKPGEYRWRKRETGEIDYVGNVVNIPYDDYSNGSYIDFLDIACHGDYEKMCRQA